MPSDIVIIDRRKNPATRQMTGRQRYLLRKKEEIRKAVGRALTGGSIKGKYDDVVVNISDTKEPTFHFDGASGQNHMISPGNRWFQKGDKYRKSPLEEGEGRAGGAGNGGGGGDAFSFILTRQEFLDIFYEDLCLPDLMRKANADVEVVARQRAGYKPLGNPADLDVRLTSRNALGRRIALGRMSAADLDDLESELEELEKNPNPETSFRIQTLKEEIEAAKARFNMVPWIDPVDVRYRQRVDVVKPRERVVMFCLMDVSGSMGEREKDIAKRYFLLLLTLLERTYGENKVEVVYIRHHDTAEECSEDDFFHKRESGGTVVSSGVQMISDIIGKRYPADEWNIYIAQASDGDNWEGDNAVVEDILVKKLLPVCQYYTYIDIPYHIGRFGSSALWPLFEKLSQSYKNLAARQIGNVSHIWPVFQDLFKKARSRG